MTPKAKFALVIGGIITFLLGWVVLVMSLIDNGKDNLANARDLKFNADINGKAPKNKINTGNNNTINTGNNNITKNKINKDNQKKNIKKEEHTLSILTPDWINSSLAWKFFSSKYKKQTGGTIENKFYNDIDEYNKDLIYKLATKSSDFDMAIIPSEWFNSTKELSKLSFQIPNLSFQISSLFDYNFNKYLKNNNIKAIPFSIDPIIGYTLSNKNIDTNLDFEKWKRIIITNPKRLDKKGKIKFMPIFLGYDKLYIKYIEKAIDDPKKTKKTIFPIFDYIIKYYKFKKDRKGLELIKDFGTNITYKTFDFKLYQKDLIRLRKNKICKGKLVKYCLLASGKTNLVYGFTSDLNLIKKNQLSLYKSFKFKLKNTQLTTLAISPFSEYPARGWIIIINPNSKNLKYIGNFLKTYINLGKEGKLPFYKNMISPFLNNREIRNNKIKYLEKYLGKIITFDKFGVGLQNNLDKKILNYLKGDISLDILLK